MMASLVNLPLKRNNRRGSRETSKPIAATEPNPDKKWADLKDEAAN
jgi:hypothetical protein